MTFDARSVLETIAAAEADAFPGTAPDEMKERFFVVWSARWIMEPNTPEGTPTVDLFKGFAILAARSPSTEARAFYSRQLDVWTDEEEEEGRAVQAARAYVQHWIRGETTAGAVALWTAYAEAAKAPQGQQHHPETEARLAAERDVLSMPVSRRATSHLRQVPR